MMLGKDYMLAIVIVNYEGRCIFTELAGSWTVVFEFQCCLSMHVSVSSYMGMKFISVMTSSAETVWLVHAVLICQCWCGVVSVCVLLQKLAALPLPLLNCTLACSCMLTEAITG